MREKKLSPRGIKDIKTLLSALMQMAVDARLINENPVKHATINKKKAQENAKDINDDDTFFDVSEAELFLHIIEGHPLELFFTLCLLLGLRREEALGLQWHNIDLEKKSLSILHTVTLGTTVNRLNSTKTESSRRSYTLPDTLLSKLKAQRQKENEYRAIMGNSYHDNDYVFKYEDGSYFYPDRPSKEFRKIIKANPELPQNIRLHGLRTSCVSILAEKGFSITEIQKYVGHASPETTLKIYSKVKSKRVKETLTDTMGDLLSQEEGNDNP